MAENKIEIKRYDKELDELFLNIREKDLNELNLFANHLRLDSKMLLRYQIQTSSNAFSVFCDGNLLFCCGYIKYEKAKVCDCWLFTTKYVEKHKKTFVKTVSSIVKKIMQETKCSLKIVTNTDYCEAVKLNKFLGFSCSDKVFNINGTICSSFVLKGEL